MTAAMAAYTVNDAFMKRVAESLPIFQTVALRGVPLLALLWLVARRTNARVDRSLLSVRPLQLRVVMEMCLVVCFLLTLVKVPFAALAAILQLVPILVSFAAARLLHERVSPVRIFSLVLGFLGVLLIVRPGTSDFNPWFLLGFVTVGVIVVRELSTRQVASEIPTAAVALITATAVSVLGAVISISEDWTTPTAADLAMVLGAAGAIALAHLASVITIRTGDVSFSALFRPTALVFAIVLQIIVFDDVPDRMTFLGCALIAVAALIGLSRGGRASPEPAPSAQDSTASLPQATS